jgi:hypothetical protein
MPQSRTYRIFSVGSPFFAPLRTAKFYLISKAHVSDNIPALTGEAGKHFYQAKKITGNRLRMIFKKSVFLKKMHRTIEAFSGQQVSFEISCKRHKK